MRRPAQHRLGPTATHGWTHPYTGVTGMAVFYNGAPGGAPATPPAPAPAPAAPSPAELAARAGQQPPNPAAPPGGPQPLVDKETGLAMTQDRFSAIMTRQYEKSQRAAFREMAEAAGIPYDPATFDLETFKKSLKDAEDARKLLLTDEQRRTADIEAREQAILAREAAAVAKDAETAKLLRQSQLEGALVRLGAVDTTDEPNLQDAFAMLERDLAASPDADAAAITAAAVKLKERRPALFATTTAPALPPAPSGGPAAGGAPRPAAAGKDAIRERARKMAIDRGLRTDDAA